MSLLGLFMKYYVRLNTFWGDLVCKKNLKKHRLYYKNQVPIYDDDDDDVGGGGAVVDADEDDEDELYDIIKMMLPADDI